MESLLTGKGLYTSTTTALDRVGEVRDLGVIFSTNLSFRSHIEIILNKAYRLLGFIKRTSYDFRKFS